MAEWSRFIPAFRVFRDILGMACQASGVFPSYFLEKQGNTQIIPEC